eukprot:m.27582 g.27582  ORF g.27582 m.27582 type:complete len:586 (+) comp13979_c0_seq1:461-2218(+)
METAPKIQQLFEPLPDIGLRPNSAATSSSSHSHSQAQSSSSAFSTRAPQPAAPSRPYLTPKEAVSKFKRVLTSYELEEVHTYPQIYFVGPSARKITPNEDKPNHGMDDEKGRYKCVKNDHVAYRFEILKGLGKGSFGDVVKTYDHKTKTHMALKIIRNERRFHKQAQSEVKILDLLRKQDKRNAHNVIHMNEYFLFRNHLCITFELLHVDLYSALKKDSFKGFTLRQVQRFGTKLLQCLRVLRRQKIIHCDLKPENILLQNRETDDIKVIDFGSSCLEHQKVHTYIQSRFYRAPEVILGASYSTAIDMWSFACILCELYTGHPVFPGRDEKEQLMYQMEVLGVPPSDFLRSQCKRTNVFFDSMHNPRFLTDRKGRRHLPSTRNLSRALGTDDELFLDFLKRCFVFDPSERMSPREASKHPWISGTSPVVLVKGLPASSSSASPHRDSRASTSSTFSSTPGASSSSSKLSSASSSASHQPQQQQQPTLMLGQSQPGHTTTITHGLAGMKLLPAVPATHLSKKHGQQAARLSLASLSSSESDMPSSKQQGSRSSGTKRRDSSSGARRLPLPPKVSVSKRKQSEDGGQ